MSDQPTTESHAKAIRILTGMLPMLDSTNPNNRAFKQVSIIFVFVAYFFTSKTLFSPPGNSLCLALHALDLILHA
jgi:hypothetical protein